MLTYAQIMLLELSNGIDIATVNVCNGAGDRLEYDYQNEFTAHHLSDGQVYRISTPDGSEVEKWLSFGLSTQRLSGLRRQVDFLNAHAQQRGYRGRVVGMHQMVDDISGGSRSPMQGYPDRLLSNGYHRHIVEGLWQILVSYLDKGYKVTSVASLWRNTAPDDRPPTQSPDHPDHWVVAEASRVCLQRLYETFGINCRWDQAYVYTISLPTPSNANPYGNTFQRLLDEEGAKGLYGASWEYSTGYLHWQWTTQPGCDWHRDYAPVPQEYFLNEPVLRLRATDASSPRAIGSCRS